MDYSLPTTQTVREIPRLTIQMNIPYYIEQELKIITKENNKEWVEKISYDIQIKILLKKKLYCL